MNKKKMLLILVKTTIMLFILFIAGLSCLLAYFALIFWEGAGEPDATMLELYLLFVSFGIVVFIIEFILKHNLRKLKIISISFNMLWIIYTLYLYISGIDIMPMLLDLIIPMLIITIPLFLKSK